MADEDVGCMWTCCCQMYSVDYLVLVSFVTALGSIVCPVVGNNMYVSQLHNNFFVCNKLFKFIFKKVFCFPAKA